MYVLGTGFHNSKSISEYDLRFEFFPKSQDAVLLNPHFSRLLPVLPTFALALYELYSVCLYLEVIQQGNIL